MNKAVEATITFTIQVDDIDLLRNEAISRREACWNDAENWIEEMGGKENLTAEEAFYEIIFASDGDTSPDELGFQVMRIEPDFALDRAKKESKNV